MCFSEKDIQALEKKGLAQEVVAHQIEQFKTGFPFAKLDRAATIGDGILQFSNQEKTELIQHFKHKQTQLTLEKFVPASGAASRMFKHLYAAKEGELSAESDAFFKELSKFAFYPELQKSLESAGEDIKRASSNSILSALLENPLNYGSKPKALIQFHKYSSSEIRLALEEHFVEAIQYAKGKADVCNLHFTVSPNHLTSVESACNQLKLKYAKNGVTFNVNFSTQESSTDTIAVQLDNTPFRDNQGNLLFRPGGHGALLINLQKTNGDIVFVKNIDNVCKESMQADTYAYKQLLAGLLLKVQEAAHNYINTGETSELDKLKELGVPVPEKASHAEIELFLDRPIRVCGMVKNQGEPGGGPFWVKANKTVSLQIVEKAQIDVSDQHQKEILNNATHFNPVDLVCSIKNRNGEPFDLLNYRDNDTGFISEKSLNGKPLKAMELPGLWNGAMANWLTLFVEVPLSTFNPVKTVNDLLKPSHQPNI